MAPSEHDFSHSQTCDQSGRSSLYSQRRSSSSPRWKGFSLPWSRRGPHNKSGATDEEVLAAMKEANRDRTLVAEADEEVNATLGVIAEFDSINLSHVSPFQFASSHHGATRSNRSSARYSQHQQRDSVNSMQQFYHPPNSRDEERFPRYQTDFCFDQSTQTQQGQMQDRESNSGVLHSRSSSTEGCSDCQAQHINELCEQSQEVPAIQKIIARLSRRPHNYSRSSGSNSTLSSVAPSTSFSPPTAASHPRSVNDMSRPPSTFSITTTTTPSPSSPATLNETRRNSPTLSMASKLKAFGDAAAMRPSTPQHCQLSNEDDLYLSIDMSNDERGVVNPVIDTRLATTAYGVSPDTYSPSEASVSQSSMTLATTQECTIFEEQEEVCFPCSFPGWQTVKAGLLPTSKQAREALMATIVLALLTIALESILLQRHKYMTASLTGTVGPYEISFFRPLTVYYFIFILAEVFAVGLLWDAAIHKNSLQLVAFTMFEWCMVSYSGLQIWQHDQLVKDIGIPDNVLMDLEDSNTRMILFSQLGVQVTACLGITLLTWRLYSEFGWLVFQKLGADMSLRKMLKEYRLLFTLLKLDAFFFFGYAIQIAALTDKHWQKGLIEVAFAIPLSAVIILLGFYALRHENKVTMGGFIACLALLIGYMTYRLVALYSTVTGEPATDPYFFSRKTMTVFAALTLFMTILALIYAIVMLYNFNKGLKEASTHYVPYFLNIACRSGTYSTYFYYVFTR
ncbi:hypothetical protein EDD21DRAFT_91818 [Dissophora ornata]|nr:hypothetical protein EDD21DRAFT_91818 [Dissophora ornata]